MLRLRYSKMNNMKYWLFDLAVAFTVAASIATACRSILVNGNTHTVSTSGGGAPLVGSSYCAGDDSDASEPAFQIGDLVEVHEPKIHRDYAFVAQIENVFVNDKCDGKGGDAVQYDVSLGFGGDRYTKINASAIRPMEPFERKTRAMCDDGRTLNSKIIPCTVEFHVPTSKKFFGEGSGQGSQHPWLYSVSYQDEDGEVGTRKMPVSRIRRIMREDEEEEAASNVSRSAKEEIPKETKKVRSPITPVDDHVQQDDSSSSDSATFPVGSVIELYGPGAYYAFPATVTGVTNPHIEAKYDLIHGITHHNLKNVDTKFVHSYNVYPEGTVASCNVGKLRKVIMVPCTVVSYAKTNPGDDSVVYQVRAIMVDQDWGEEPPPERVLFLPRLRVQRKIEKVATADGRQ